MAWTRIIQPLNEGQFIRLRKPFNQSTFQYEISVSNALYSLKYHDLHNYSRHDTSLKQGTIGKIITPYNSTDGSYLINFQSDTNVLNNEIKPRNYFKGNGQVKKIIKNKLFEIADVWID